MSTRNFTTAVRLRAAARVVRPFLNGGPRPQLLDVGCGDSGVAAFLPGVPIHGVDFRPPLFRDAGFTFHRANVTALPYRDRAFPVVCCVDVLEHLSLSERERAVEEMLRVAGRLLVLACPQGPAARACDDRYLTQLQARGRTSPAWVEEHLRHPYPDAHAMVASVRVSAGSQGRETAITLNYCESIRVTWLLRTASVYFPKLYATINILFGLLEPLLPGRSAASSYRMVMTVFLD